MDMNLRPYGQGLTGENSRAAERNRKGISIDDPRAPADAQPH